MQIRIVTVIPSIKGGEIRQEQTQRCQEITLGRGSNQVLQVAQQRVALAHAVLVPGEQTGQFELRTHTPTGLRVNGRTRTHGKVQIKDVIELGDKCFKLLPGDADHDLCIEIHPAAETDQQSSYQPPPQRALLGRRGYAWLGLLSVLVIGLGLPLWHFYQPSDATPLPTLGSLGDDRIWLSGPVSGSHRHFADDCSNCHQQPFQQVQDSSCLQCHSEVSAHAHHADIRHPQVLSLDCASCHKEHNREQLVLTDQHFCADCHQDVPGVTGFSSELLAASDFADDHPAFRATLANPNAQGEVITTRVEVSQASEQSRLNFPHDVHLDPQGLESPDGVQVLECSNCHQLDAAGAYLQPIRFLQHCQSCHQLNFDPSNPDRVVPHGKPGEVVDVLTEFYAELALRGAANEVSGIPLNSQQPADVLLWARRTAMQTGDRLFQGRACGECHQVSREATEQRITWRVEPPRVQGVWFPKSRFNHASHASSDCETCHAASTSNSSNDLLLPEIGVCRDCHGGQHSRGLLQSDCLTCHQFHNPMQVLMNEVLQPREGSVYLWDEPDTSPQWQPQQPSQMQRRRPGRDY